MTNNIEITLLTKEEYVKYKNIIPLIDSGWWLKDACPDSHCAVHCVDRYGVPDSYSCYYSNGVRPVLKMNVANLKSLNPGDKIRIGSKSFTVLSWDEFELIALCDTFIDKRYFDSNGNEWEKSELKEWLETEGLKLIF